MANERHERLMRVVRLELEPYSGYFEKFQLDMEKGLLPRFPVRWKRAEPYYEQIKARMLWGASHEPQEIDKQAEAVATGEMVQRWLLDKQKNEHSMQCALSAKKSDSQSQDLQNRSSRQSTEHSLNSEQPLKKQVLIHRHQCIWPSIEKDLSDAGRNGLRAAAAIQGRHGYWHPANALEWAKKHGKLKEVTVPLSTASFFHRLK